jgi:small GTP-binding protein
MKNVKKISVLGLSGVGKSTLIKMLLSSLPVPTNSSQYKPTIGLDVQSVQLGENQVCFWDLGGQDQFRFMWDSFVHGTSTILVVTDSTKAGALKTKEFVDKYSKLSGAKLIVLANKQDLPGALSPREVESITGAETHGLVAIDPTSKQALFKLLERQLSS